MPVGLSLVAAACAILPDRPAAEDLPLLPWRRIVAAPPGSIFSRGRSAIRFVRRRFADGQEHAAAGVVAPGRQRLGRFALVVGRLSFQLLARKAISASITSGCGMSSSSGVPHGNP